VLFLNLQSSWWTILQTYILFSTSYFLLDVWSRFTCCWSELCFRSYIALILNVQYMVLSTYILDCN
jgi:hypothetical protein